MKWSHGHSIGIGTVVGLSFAPHAWLLFVGGTALGWFGRDVYSAAKTGGRLVARKLAR